MFLPDFRVYDYILSLQDPYLLNGYIIVHIDIDEENTPFNSSRDRYIILRNENNDYARLNINDLGYCLKGTMDNFIAHYGRDARVDGRMDIHDWHWYDLECYCRDIHDQCERIRHSHSNYYEENSYLNVLKRDLRRQRREFREPARLSRYYYENELQREYYNRWCEPVSMTMGYTSESATEALRYLSNTMRHSGISLSNDTINFPNKRKYIHEYNYKPEFIYHYMPDEDKETTLLLGAEIEVAGNTNIDLNKEDVVKECIQIMNGSEDDTENLIYSTSDSTVQIELDTMPCSLEFHKNKMNYRKLFAHLDKLGYKGHDCDSAGLHIHADRKYLGKSELVQQLTISKILYILEKFNDEICVIARRNNNYSKFVGKEEVNKSLNKLYNKYQNEGKKVALNLQHKETIEFRMFRSTLKYETFILTLEFVKDIIDYAKSINIEEIELIKWSDLMDTFSDELKEYYNERLAKETKKEEESKQEKLTNGYYVFNGDRFTINASNIVTSNPYLYGLNSELTYYNETAPMRQNQFRDYMLSRATLADCMSSISININNQTTEKTELEILKDKEKTLKKKIKYSNNPLEKKNLDKELKEVQKELKKEKKRIKLNNNTES